jgi:hypothetical protein
MVFDLTSMTAKARQMTALRELRSLAVTSWNSIQDDKRRMRALIQEVSLLILVLDVAPIITNLLG